MIEPKQIEIKGKQYIISKFPAVAGREIITQYPISAIPKLGDYQANEALLFKMLAYCAVVLPDGNKLSLTTRAVIDNHVPSWEALMTLEKEVLEYNCSFLEQGGLLAFLSGLAENIPALITSISTQS